LSELVLTEFPVFALNEDYLAAVYQVIISKIDTAKKIINAKKEQMQEL